MRARPHESPARLPRLTARAVGAGAAAAVLAATVAPQAHAESTLGQSPYQVSVDIDGDGRPDTVTLSTSGSGKRTKILLERDSRPPVRHALPFRGAGAEVTTGERLEGVAPLTSADRGDLVILSRTGRCSGYRILRWASGRFRAVPSPFGTAEWRVCGLGVAPEGRGFTTSSGRRGARVIAFVGREHVGEVRVRRTAFRWDGRRWRESGSRSMSLPTAAALPMWGLDFPWRSV